MGEDDMIPFTEIDRWMEQHSIELKEEGINSAKYWKARFDISDEEWEEIIIRLAGYVTSGKAKNQTEVVCWAVSCGLNYGIIYGSQFENVTENA